MCYFGFYPCGTVFKIKHISEALWFIEKGQFYA